MAGEPLQEPFSDSEPDRGGDRLQESVFGDAAAGAAAVFAGLGAGVSYARYRMDRGAHDAEMLQERLEMQAEIADLRRQLGLERRQRFVEQHGLDALDVFDRLGVDEFTGFGVEGDAIDLTRDDWFDVE